MVKNLEVVINGKKFLTADKEGEIVQKCERQFFMKNIEALIKASCVNKVV